MVYFNYLFQQADDITPVEGLVYSELVFHSLTSNEKCCVDGMLNLELAREETMNLKIQLHKFNFVTGYLPIETTELMKRTELTFPTVKKALASLESKDYIKDGWLECPLQLLEKGYIKIPYNTGLKGRQLIFYAFLLNRASRYKGIVDTWAYRFKELCNIEEGNIYMLISRLKANGLIERTEDGKLRVLLPEDRERKRGV